MTSMDADVAQASSQADATEASTSIEPAVSSSSYRTFLGDADGQLKLFRIATSHLSTQAHDVQLPKLVKLRKGTALQAASPELAVQKMADGVVNEVGWVIAVARRNATIDIIRPADPTHDGEEQDESEATLLATIKNPKMKAGLQRWVGLAVSYDGIYAVTSAGDFTFTRLRINSQSSSASTSKQTSSISQLETEAVRRLELPEPLQCVPFHPTSNPTHFLYGGEEVPLSLWDIQTALSSPPKEPVAEEEEVEFAAPEGEPVKAVNGGNAKLRKRKRQAEARAKAKELLWGEVWRAKNLPNDALSLPQRPNITAIAVLERTNGGKSPAATSGGEENIPDWQVVVGTRDGFLRTFEPASGARKYTKQVRVVPQNQQGSIRLVTQHHAELNGNEVITADSNGKLSVVDHVEGKLKYQWKDITGAISSVVTFPPPNVVGRGPSLETDPLVLSASLDRLLRLHTMPSSEGGKELGKRTVQRGTNVFSTFTGGANATAMVWDGVVPLTSPTQPEEDEDESMRKDAENESGDESDEDNEDVWDAMQEVGEGVESEKRRPKGDRVKSGSKVADSKNGSQEDEEDDTGKAEALKEQRSKRNRQ